MNVAILGASAKPDRYSYKAFTLLREKGHNVFPVNPVLTNLEGVPVFPSLTQITEPLDTITVYLSQKNQQSLEKDILECAAKRVIFNPGAENPSLAASLREAGATVLEACTIVMLKTDQF